MRIIIVSFFCILASTLWSQPFFTVLQGTESDSSFYHLEKINANEFWVGGEYGILKSIDTLGNVINIDGFENDGKNILVIKRVGDKVYVATDNSLIYCYDLETKLWQKKYFKKFKNRCFYDLLEIENGKILVCGGTTGIATGLKKIPNGFVGLLNFEAEKIDVVWKNKLKFVWSMTKNEKQFYIVTYNGFNSKIKSTYDLKQWKTTNIVKGLVHEIDILDNEMWFSGTKNMSYSKSGIYGLACDGKTPKTMSKVGCIWSISGALNNKFGVTNDGTLLNLLTQQQIRIPKAFTLYDLKFITNQKLLLVGHGKGIYIMNL
jgi:hypothetical protein